MPQTQQGKNWKAILLGSLVISAMCLGGGFLSAAQGTAGHTFPKGKQPVRNHPLQKERQGLTSLVQRLDAVFVEGARLPGLRGKRIENIRLLADREGRLQPIPFQVDEYRPDGSLVLTGGKGASKDTDPLFDHNDVLMFMARDTGVRTPMTGGQDAAFLQVEIQVTDPVDGSMGWIYLSCSQDPPTASPHTYVRYTIKEGEIDRVDTRGYSIPYPWGAYYSDTMLLYPVSNRHGVDFMDRLKTRGLFTCFFSIIKLRLSEEKMGAEVVGFRCGPIRLVRRVKYWADLGLGLRSPSFLADIIYYDFFMNAPVTTRIPVRLDLFFTKAFGELGSDYTKEAYGMTFKNSNNPEGTLIDGRMSPQEKRLDLDFDEWRLTTGVQGTFFRGALPENDMMAQVDVELAYVDDITVPDPPEAEPGQVGHIYDRVNVINVKPGVYKSDIVFLVPPDYRPGDEKLYLEWERQPLDVEIRLLSNHAAEPSIASKEFGE